MSGTPTYTFAGNPLDPCQNQRHEEGFVDSLIKAESSQWLAMYNNQVLVQNSRHLAWNSLSEIQRKFGVVNHDRTTLLGLYDKVGFFVTDVAVERPHGTENKELKEEFVSLRTLLNQADFYLDEVDLTLAGAAATLTKWHQKTKFCGNCGHLTESSEGGFKRKCVSCKKSVHPRVDPVVIMLVTDGSRVMLANENRYPSGMYSLLAGFMTPGESIEEAVRREVFEEIGLRVSKVNYHSSQPWLLGPYSQLMIGCTAEIHPTDRAKDLKIDQKELNKAGWYSPKEVWIALRKSKEFSSKQKEFRLPPSYAIAHHLCKDWALRNLESPSAL